MIHICLEMEGKIEQMVSEYKTEIVQRTETVIKNHYENNANRTYEVQTMKNLTLQMEDVQLLLINISKEMDKLQTGQLQLEKKFITQERRFDRERELQTTTLLNGTTLSNDPPGVITRSKSRLLKESQTHKIAKKNTRAIGRTIIPWEEIANDTITNNATQQRDYPSEL